MQHNCHWTPWYTTTIDPLQYLTAITIFIPSYLIQPTTLDSFNTYHRSPVLGGTALSVFMFPSCLSSHKYGIIWSVTSGASQGSMLGSLLGLISVMSLGNIAWRHNFNMPMNADNTLLFFTTLSLELPDCVTNICRVRRNCQQLNMDRIEMITYTTDPAS